MAVPDSIERPSENEIRYDRGVRLWGSAGQKAIEDAHVCLLGATAAGCEALKNLVLPGIGMFTVVDSDEVSQADLGRNFFMTSDSVGTPRAKVACELLLEMNASNVKAVVVEEKPEALLEHTPDFFRRRGVHCVILSGPRSGAFVKRVAALCARDGVHLVVIETNGLVGLLQLQSATCSGAPAAASADGGGDGAVVRGGHCVTETFAEGASSDLRVSNPFPALKAYFDSFDLPAITDSHEHSHVPWVVLLHKAALVYQKEKGVEAPAHGGVDERVAEALGTYQEKKRVKAILADMRLVRNIPDVGDVPLEEANFKEATDNLNRHLVPVLRASAEVQEDTGVLPVSGTIPDMTSTSESYAALRGVYRRKALEDRDVVFSHATEELARQGRDPSLLSPDECARFCRNAANLRVVEHRALSGGGGDGDDSAGNVDAVAVKRAVAVLKAAEGAFAGCEKGSTDEAADVAWVLLREASRLFHEEHGRHPGALGAPGAGDAAAVQEDVNLFLTSLRRLLSPHGFPEPDGCGIPLALVKDWVRFGTAELHTVAAILGGIASQEVIKLVTRQRVPVNNTLVFNGILNRTFVVEC